MSNTSDDAGRTAKGSATARARVAYDARDIAIRTSAFFLLSLLASALLALPYLSIR